MKKIDFIAAKLEEKIRSENLPKGTPLPSTRKMALNFNVSYVTAYRAVSKLVDKNMIYRIDGKGTFASGSSNANAKTVGILWGETTDIERARNSFISGGILMGLSKRAGEKRMNIRNIFMNEHIANDLRGIDYLISVAGVWGVKTHLTILKNIKCPHLCLSMKHNPVNFCNNLCVDMHGMFRQAIEYLHSLGYFNIGFIDHGDRHKTFLDTKQLLGAPNTDGWIIKESAFQGYDEATERGRTVADEIFKKHPEMDAIISISDHVALGIYQKSMELKKDFAVIGTDNVEGSGFMSPFGEPVLTCVAPSYWHIGERAVDMLEDLNTNPKGELAHLYIQTKLIKRKSCGESN